MLLVAASAFAIGLVDKDMLPYAGLTTVTVRASSALARPGLTKGLSVLGTPIESSVVPRLKSLRDVKPQNSYYVVRPIISI